LLFIDNDLFKLRGLVLSETGLPLFPIIRSFNAIFYKIQHSATQRNAKQRNIIQRNATQKFNIY